MACFLYYLPQRPGAADARTLAAAGLGYAVDRDDPGLATSQVSGGPDGGGGLICAATARIGEQALGYYPDRQRWQKAGANWVGMETTSPPAPADLIRRRVLPGHGVRLMDGGQWLVPVARQIIETGGRIGWRMALPTVDRWLDGHWEEGDVADEHRPLWLIACRWWEAICGAAAGDAGVSFDFQGLRDAAVAAIQANYVVGPAEAGMLGLLSEQGCIEVMQALVDWPAFLAAQKKTAPRGPC